MMRRGDKKGWEEGKRILSDVNPLLSLIFKRRKEGNRERQKRL